MNGKRLRLPVFAVALAVATAASALADSSDRTQKTMATKATTRAPTRVSAKRKPLRRVNPSRVRHLRSTVWRWQAVMGVSRATSSGAALRSPRALRYWVRQARRVRRLAAHPPHLVGWLCIHRYEGSWQDSGDPYWGGLQMDRGFMETYAPRVLLRRGWADRWTPIEQMWVAERAHRSGRGYWPWPSTARSCGLI
jgi:hypothetical protein